MKLSLLSKIRQKVKSKKPSSNQIFFWSLISFSFIIGLFILLLSIFKKTSLPKTNISSINQPQKIINQTPTSIPKKVPVANYRYCGRIPVEMLPINPDRFTKITGPGWSPNCQFIAWSVELTGFYRAPQSYKEEGIFLYNAHTKSTKKIFETETNSQLAEFLGWLDENELVFSLYPEKKEVIYSIKTGQLREKKLF